MTINYSSIKNVHSLHVRKKCCLLKYNNMQYNSVPSKHSHVYGSYGLQRLLLLEKGTGDYLGV